MDLKNKRILITGGTGFIGKHLVDELLNHNNKLFLITRKRQQSENDNLKYLYADLSQLNENLSEKIKKELKLVDYILYLAANIPLLSASKETIFDAKISTFDPFINFLKFFGNIGNKIIFTSTIDVYGYPDKEYDENQSIDPLTPYALAKFVCEKYLQYYCKIYKKEFSIVRFAQVYGPNEPLVRVIPYILNSAVKNEPFSLSGSGLDKRKFLYVKDAVQGIIKTALNGNNSIYHIAGSEVDNILNVIRITENVFNKKIIIKQKNKEREIQNTLPNLDKSIKKLGYNPKYTLERGIKEIFNIMRV
ncbi:MAG: UDP-glucose 4-epimerase [Parcubacteria group bacterium GW2011_GWA2_31_28]|nr:MAG: UDP-glucose 4-epimerase [Parcubacteria group bacterium GW2011_GWA2_31_28]